MVHSNTSAAASELDDAQKNILRHALSPVASDLANLREKITSFLPLETTSSQAIASHIFSTQGKLIRPALFFLSARLCGYTREHLTSIGAVCEYVHTASLLHDDVVDHSDLRRKKPTANKVWGDEAAVLVGDLIYSRASELMAATGEMDLVSTFARAIRKMSEGELIQLENLYNYDFSQDSYLRLLSCKTGVLIGAACRAGGILAQVSAQKRDALQAFGHNIGLAFQLIDDALDFMGSRDNFGKPTQIDLIEGKVTLPVILLREMASSSEKQKLKTILEQPAISKKEANEISQLVSHYQTARLTIEKAGDFTASALSALQDNFQPSQERSELEQLAHSLLTRLS